MSALLETPFTVPATPPERRGARRLRVSGSIPVHLGRGEGVLIDISERGARVRHSFPVQRGATVRLAFEWQGERFAASAEVLASRVAALGDGAGGATLYESRLRYAALDDERAAILQRVLANIEDRDIRKWVANLRGWREGNENGATARVSVSYVRCRLRGAWWERKLTHDAKQPEDGFTLPATADEGEITRLCDSYLASDREGRNLIRSIAAAVVAQPD